MLKYIGNILFCCGDIIFEKKAQFIACVDNYVFFFQRLDDKSSNFSK